MRSSLIAALGALAAVTSLARGALADNASPFQEQPPAKPKAPGERVSFQVEDADLSELVKAIGELTGKRFVVATAKPKSVKATVYASSKLTVDEAYHAFLAVLQGNGLTVIPDGAVSKIVESADAVRQTTPIVGEVPPEERYVTRIHRLAHASADDVSALLLKLSTRDGSVIPYAAGNLLIMTDTGTNLRRMLAVVEEVDVGGAQAKLYVQPLYYAASADVEKKLSDLFDLKKKLDGPELGELRITRIVAFERPNALAIVATEPSYQRLLEVLKRIDVPVTNEGQIHVVPLQHADAKKIVAPLNEALGGAAQAQGAGGLGAPASASVRPSALAILESPVKVSADETTNALLVTSSPRDYASIKAVIDRLDQPKRQVYIEAVVMDVSADRGMDLGVAWHGGTTMGKNDDSFAYGGFRPGASALPPNATDLQAAALGIRGPEIKLPFAIPVGTSTVTSIPSLGAFITAAASTRGADILSTPSITASDNTPAELKVQLKTSLTPHAPSAPIFAAGGQVPSFGASQSANLQSIGPRIKVTPHMNDSNEVRLDVEEVISDIQSVPDKSDTYGAISFIERSATTTLTVKDGETMVIGGLVRNRVARSETKMPVLGDIPLLGVLFRSTSEQMEKSNLLLVLTPHIIRDESDKRRIVEGQIRQRQEMIDHAVIFSGMSWAPPVDWTKTHGLLQEIHAQQRRVAEEQELEKLRAPLDVRAHEPADPLEIPAPPVTWGAPARAPVSASPAASPATSPVRVER